MVAAKPQRFGNELYQSPLREYPRSEEAVPAGAFAKINDAPSPGKRVVLAAIEVNENLSFRSRSPAPDSAPRSRRCCMRA